MTIYIPLFPLAAQVPNKYKYSDKELNLLNQRIWILNEYESFSNLQTFTSVELSNEKINKIAEILKKDEALEVTKKAGTIKGHSQLHVTIKRVAKKITEAVPETEKKISAAEKKPSKQFTVRPATSEAVDKEKDMLNPKDNFEGFAKLAKDPLQKESLKEPIKEMLQQAFPKMKFDNDFFLNAVYCKASNDKAGYFIEISPTFGSGRNNAVIKEDLFFLTISEEDLKTLKQYILLPLDVNINKNLLADKNKYDDLIKQLIKKKGGEPYYKGYSIENIYKRDKNYFFIAKPRPGIRLEGESPPPKHYLVVKPNDLAKYV